MSLSVGRGPRLLPPLARGRDWIAAGIGAGLCLGAAESLGLWLQGIELAAGQALALVAADAAAVGVFSLPLALGTALTGHRLCHSTVAGGIVGAILAAPALAHALMLEPLGDSAPLALVLGVGLAVVGGGLGAWAGGRLEGAGIPISGPPLWAAVALLVAATRTFRAGGPLPLTPAIFVIFVAVVLLLALLAALLAVLAGHRESLIPWPWSRTLLALTLAAGGTALAPWLIPWLVMDPPGAGAAPPAADLFILDLGSFPADEAPQVGSPRAGTDGSVSPNLTLLAATGVLFERVVEDPNRRAAFDWLVLPDGVPLARVLRAQGYLARLVGSVDPRELPPGFERELGRGSLEGKEAALRATVGGALLSTFGADTLAGGSRAPRAARITAQARHRIATARALDPDRPLLLVVDYREAERNAALLDDEVGVLTDFLAGLGLEGFARIVVTWSEDGPANVPSLRRGMRVLLRPEPDASGAPRGEVVEMPVLASEVAERVAGRQASGSEPR